MKAWFETDILLDPRLSKNDIKVMIVLSAHANNEGICWPSRQRIADKSGIFISNITPIINRLRDYGHIEIHPSTGHSNRYKLLKYEAPEVKKNDALLESNNTQEKVLLESNKGGLLESSKGGLLEPNNQNYVYNYTNNYKNKKSPKSVSKTEIEWKRMSFSKFKSHKSKPEFTDEFNSIWKRYKKACSELDSETGGKLQAFFRFLILKENGFVVSDITLSLRKYVESKRKSGMTMAHLSTVFNDPDLLRQFLEDEKDDHDEKQPEIKVEIPDFSTRFELSPTTSDTGQNSTRRANDSRIDIDEPSSRFESTGIRDK